jgi:nonsense-mediated mRNA decay protein 3
MKFCVECGKDVSETFNGLCSECASKRAGIKIPEIIDLVLCKDCGLRMKRKNWVNEADHIREAVEENLEERDAVLRKMDLNLLSGDEYAQNWEVHAVMDSFGQKIERTAETKIRIRYVLCPSCARKRGGYYEAKLQLRGRIPEDWEKHVTEAYAENVKGGIDLYFSSLADERTVVKKFASMRNVEVKESKKLHTVKNGKAIYKYTTLLRFDENSHNSRKQKR